MSLIEKAFLLKESPLFSNLNLDELLSISDKLEMIGFKKGATLFTSSQDATRLFLIIEGTIEILSKSGEKIATLAEGEIFGDEALFSEKPRAYTAIAATPVKVLTLSRSHLLAIIDECPAVALNFLEAYASHWDFRPRKPRRE